MTLRQLIDDASTLGLTTGLDVEVRTWNLGREPIEPAGISKAVQLCIGSNEKKTGVIAYLKIKP